MTDKFDRMTKLPWDNPKFRLAERGAYLKHLTERKAQVDAERKAAKLRCQKARRKHGNA